MKQQTFRKFLSAMESFNSRQLRQMEAELQKIKDQAKTANLLETSFENITCPHCGSYEKWRWGKRTQLQRYRCKSCKKTYNSLTSTPLARLNKKDKWLLYSNCLKNGLSVRKAASQCGIHKNTAFLWRHRFLKLHNSIKPTELNGIIETKETYFRKSEKGSRKLRRKARKRGGKKIRLPKAEHVCLLIARDRYRNTFDTLIQKLSTSSILKSQQIFSKDALFCSEAKWIYRNFTKKAHLRHGTLKLTEGEECKKDIVHLKNVTNYQQRLTTWLLRFHGVATKYLNNYLAWYRSMDEFNLQISPETILIRAKAGGNYKFQPLCRTEPHP